MRNSVFSFWSEHAKTFCVDSFTNSAPKYFVLLVIEFQVMRVVVCNALALLKLKATKLLKDKVHLLTMLKFWHVFPEEVQNDHRFMCMKMPFCLFCKCPHACQAVPSPRSCTSGADCKEIGKNQ